MRITRFVNGSHAALYIYSHCLIGEVAPGATISTNDYIGKVYDTIPNVAALLRELRREFRVKRDPEQAQTVHVYKRRKRRTSK